MSMKNKTNTNNTSSSNPTSSVAASPVVASPVVPPVLAAPAASPPASPSPAPAPTPSAQQLAALVQQIVPQFDAMEAQLGADPPLSPAEKRRSLRMRKGGGPIVTTIGDLVRSGPLGSSGLVDVDQMQQALARATALQPLATRLAAFHNHVLDLIFVGESTSWSKAVHAYGLLKRLSRTDADLATALEPVTAFFTPKKAPAPPGTPNKRTRKATNKAVKQLKKHAPQLLAGGTQPAGAEAAPTAASPATPAAPTTGSPSGNGAPRS